MSEKILRFAGLAALLAVAIPTCLAAAATPNSQLAIERPLFVPGELILKFSATESFISRQAFLDTHGLTERRSLRGTGALLVTLPAGAEVEATVAALAGAPELEYVDPNYRRYIDGVPNDSRFDELWGMNNTGQTGGTPDADIDAPEAWDIAIGSPEIVVASLDSGLDADHVDIAENLYVNPGEIPDNGIDDDGNGYIDDVSGWDFRGNDNNPSPSGQGCVGHGTHTAGTVGAVGNNGIGVTGVAQQVKIMPLRAFYPFLIILCTADDSDLIDAIDYINLMGVPISNHSWGGSGFSNAMRDAIARARHLFVNAAGNSSANNDNVATYPSNYDLDHILVVASTTDEDKKSSFSNYGVETVELGAPGSEILSTKPGNAYGLLDGTSMASPAVAGAAVVLLSADMSLTPHELKNRLMRGTDFIDIATITGGRLNLFNSLTLAPPEVTIDIQLLSPPVIPPGGTIEYSLEVTNSAAGSRTVQVSVRLWAPNGAEPVLIGPVEVTLGPGQTVSGTLNQVTPGIAPVGEYRVIGRVSDGAENFDEDVALFAIE